MFPTGSFSCEAMQIRPPMEQPQDSVHGRFDGFQGVHAGFQGADSMGPMGPMGSAFQGFQRDPTAGSFTERAKPKDERPRDQASQAVPLWREQLLEIEVATAMEAACLV